MFEVQHF